MTDLSWRKSLRFLFLFQWVGVWGALTASAGEFFPEPFSSTAAEDLRVRIAVGGDRLLILTAAALYRFLPESEAWTVTSTTEGLPDLPLRSLSVGQGSIWVTGIGVSFSDLRFDDWQRYGPGEGYPGSVIFAVEADEDYAYAGTDQGAARFDRYVLEWESLDGPEAAPLGPIRDVAVGDDRVWFALDRGVAEYRKDAESCRIDALLGQLEEPKVLALRQSTRFLWALTDAGIARYDKDLETWSSFHPAIDLPDARVHQFTLAEDDLWLGTDGGLWRYRADTGIWRRDESGVEMPGTRVRAFALDGDRIWVVTERAFAVYDAASARWIDFTTSVPLEPESVNEMAWRDETLIFSSAREIVYGLGEGQENPSLFTYRSRAITEGPALESAPRQRWRVSLSEAGLGLEKAPDLGMHLKGGATIFVEDSDVVEAGPGLGDLVTDTRLDLTLSGQLQDGRTLSGFTDTTDPDNPAYQLTYRGSRSDALRVVSAGEIEQEPYNSRLLEGTGLRGGRARVEFGSRTEISRRRLVTADAWVGKRRTLPARDTFYGANRRVTGETRDIDYVRRQVFSMPDGWTAADLADALLYLDDGDPSTDDPNTEHRTLAGRSGGWDRLRPNEDYVLGPGGETLIIALPLAEGHALVAVRSPGTAWPLANEADLTDLWLRNRYRIATEPVPGSLTLVIVDSTGSAADGSGTPYIERFGLDGNGDGLLDPERFSPINGLLNFPDELPFPGHVYAEDPVSSFTFEYGYQSRLSTFQLSHRDVVPGSVQITVDRVLLRPDVDYSIIATSGLFVFFEHVLLDEDAVIEVAYQYETGEDPGASGAGEDGTVIASQLGFAPDDHLFCGANLARWSDDAGRDVTTAGLNTRLEWKDADQLVRVTPELAVSHTRSAFADTGEAGRGRSALASGVGFQGRHRGLELSASHRSLGGEFASFEDRRTLLGRLRQESSARGRINLGRHLQAEMEWEKSLSDGLGTGTAAWGEESSLTASARLLRSGWPNLALRRGRVRLGAPGDRRDKWISRAELELSPEQAGVRLLGIDRLWLRAFFQRSERDLEAERRQTDQAFARLNGSLGARLSWDLAFEDRRTSRLRSPLSHNVRLDQAVDATVQTQPHPSVDAFLRWESDRDLTWHPESQGGGFAVRRLLLGTVQFYPGRIHTHLSRVSFRFDLGRNETDNGEPGVSLPGAASLWVGPAEASQSRRARNGAVEARMQVGGRIRLIERVEIDSDRTTREGLISEGESWRLENRLEIRPDGGLLILRAIGAESQRGFHDGTERRLSGQWDQTWGRGWLTYVSLETHRTETRDRGLGDREDLWAPQARVTWRRDLWQLDASLGGSLTWVRTQDTSVGASRCWAERRRQSVTATLSARPLRLLSVKVQFGLNRSEVEPQTIATGTRSRWETDPDLRLRLQIRA